MSKPFRRSSGWIAASALTILALALVGSAPAPASTSILPAGAIAPTEAATRHRAQGRPDSRGGALQPRADRRQDVGGRSINATWTSSTASAATSWRATSPSSPPTVQVRRHDPHRRRRAGIRDLRPLPTTQPRAYATRASACSRRSPTGRSTRPSSSIASKAPWPRDAGGDAGAVAQARQERRAVAHVDRQAVAGSLRAAAQALRARVEARRPDHSRGRVREPDERVRALVRSALELLLAAQLGGVPHPDEPQLRGHRRLAAARG